MTELETKTEKELSRRKFLGMLGLAGAGIALAGLSGCGESTGESTKKEYPLATLKVGQGYYTAPTNEGGIFIEYAGMPSEKTFSLTRKGFRSRSNWYYTADAKEICYAPEGMLEILEVTPEYIKFKQTGKKTCD